MRKYLIISLVLILALTGCEALKRQLTDVNNKVNNNIDDITIKGDMVDDLGFDSLDAQTAEVQAMLKKQMDEALKTFKESYNVTDFNYAISFA